MHAANENDIGPGKVRRRCALDILIDETDLPALGQIGSDDQQTLGWHKRAYTGHECKRMRESAEGRRVGRKDAKDISAMLDGDSTVQTNPLTPTFVQPAPAAVEWRRR